MTECERTALYLDGELPVADEPAALAHLATCATCQAELGDWVGLETALSRSRTARAQANERFAMGSRDGHDDRAIVGIAAKAPEPRTDAPVDGIVAEVRESRRDRAGDRDIERRGDRAGDREVEGRRDRVGDRNVDRRADRVGDSELEQRRERAARAGRGRRWQVAAAGVAIAAAAAIAVVWLGRDRGHRGPVIALAETRPIEARFTAPAFDRHRVYRVERGAAARELLPVDVLVELERSGDRAGLAAAHALAGDMARAAAALEAEPPSAARDSDRAAVALAEDPVRALQLADAAIAAAPDLAAAHWNRALALRKLGLPLAAAAELDVVAGRGEPGWADEARGTAATLRAPMSARLADLRRFNEARDAMLAGSGPPLDGEAVRRRPGTARRALLDALAAAGTADEVRALSPMAAALDGQSGNRDASRRVAAVAGRDPAVRARFQVRVRALIAGKLDAAQKAQLVDELERGGDAVSDVLVAVLLRMPASGAAVARLRSAVAADDAWLGLRIARVDAGVQASSGDRFGAERALLATADACRDRAWAMECGDIDLDFAELYLPMRRLDEADRRLRAALVAYALEGRPDLEDYTLRDLANLERLRDRDWLAGAYLQEIRLRAQGATEVQRCDALRFAAESSAAIALAAGDVAAARSRLTEPGGCSKPPTALWLIDAVALARLGDAGDRDRATRWITAARGASGSRPAAADIGEGRMKIDADPAAGAAQIRAGFAALAALRVEPGTVGELRGWGFAALISDAGKRGDWAGALALFAEDLGAAVPQGCLVAASIDDERATVVARGRDGALHGSHRTHLPLGPLGPLATGSIVPAELVAALAGCDAIAVVARPPLHGRADLLPARLPWAFVGSDGPEASGGHGAQASSGKRAVVVADAQPPATLGLPPLAPVAAAGATAVGGAAATPSRVLAEIADARYVEIHAHGIVDARDAAFLALSPDADGSFALTAAQVRQARLGGAPIVVLAACRSATTARYEAYRWSLPDAFLAAGARAVIASATAIPDDQGAALFAELRARIDRGEAAAQAVAALRAARVAAGQAWAAGLIVFE